jgi:hypothetical protein
MPFDWKRLSDEQKQFKIDSLRPEMEKQLKAQGASLPTIPTPNGPRRISIEFDFVPLNKIPDYEPPISPGSAGRTSTTICGSYRARPSALAPRACCTMW